MELTETCLLIIVKDITNYTNEEMPRVSYGESGMELPCPLW
jgi:hypothetical protein